MELDNKPNKIYYTELFFKTRLVLRSEVLLRPKLRSSCFLTSSAFIYFMYKYIEINFTDFDDPFWVKEFEPTPNFGEGTEKWK